MGKVEAGDISSRGYSDLRLAKYRERILRKLREAILFRWRSRAPDLVSRVEMTLEFAKDEVDVNWYLHHSLGERIQGSLSTTKDNSSRYQ